MPLTFQRLPAAFDGLTLPAGWTNINTAVTIDKPYGGRWGTCRITFPGDCAEEARGFLGESFRISLNGTIIFHGRILEIGPTIDGTDDKMELIAHDIRWDLQRWRVGQVDRSFFGGGAVYDTQLLSGFSWVGHEILFNRDGKGDRTSSKSISGPGGPTYNFGTWTGCEKWRLIDMLEFVVNWFAPLFTVNFTALGGAANWKQTDPHVSLYGMTCLQAITHLAHLAGESWYPVYGPAGTDPSYGRITVTPIGAFTCKLESLGASANTLGARRDSVLRVSPSLRLTDSIDRIEVHSGNLLCETVYSNVSVDERDALLASYDPKHDDYWIGYRVDTQAYQKHKLGGDLPKTSRPKRWVRHLNTRLDESLTKNEYFDAGAAGLNLGRGRPLVSENAIWVGTNDYDDPLLLVGGFSIFYDEAIILLRRTIQVRLTDGTQKSIVLADDIEDAYDKEMFRIWVNINTETEQQIVRQNVGTGDHIVGNPIHELVTAGHLVPRFRFKPWLPKTRGEGITKPSGDEFYSDPRDELDRIGRALLSVRKRLESTAKIELWDFADAELGQGVSMGDDTHLQGDEVITHLTWQFGDYGGIDNMTVTATNNLARVLAEDV